jgi:tRNA threonylcarbamoyladenosine biosynthesis protein TsaB
MSLLLAFDTSTERLSIALGGDGCALRTHQGEGGAQASATLIPAITELLRSAGVALAQVDAIAFGRGPGAFTGLRTACAVAQGLAYGAGKPVLPIDTLMAVAEDARHGAGVAGPWRTWAAIDARMGEIYAAEYAFDGLRWSTLSLPALFSPGALQARWREAPPAAVAGLALSAFAGQLDPGPAPAHPAAWPDAAALLRLAGPMFEAGLAVDAALALPLYVRDKVAMTTRERALAAQAP